MDFRKLPSNSEGLLLKLVCSENPTQVLREQYNGLSMQQEQELDGIIRELKGLGYCERSGIGSAHKSESYHVRE